ncbi:type II toxin-antitoxin system HicB family antitoxin [Enterococcus hulanensis]|uniref:type II toxin-antitoxin system HicB family antitoxin n=1 Tax=Enterococcus hulanensis TaxID=2559929 RepID=UPI00288CC5B8|nr:type II toxin-antitoxin system HicB family antitoxin [Enterococcus hulanensis]MDT2661005.1 type II toxin-antitoxin system HicB family antitoxin [Enterococcus hulanensis]
MVIYYAVFNFAEDGINVVFPDLDDAATFGENMHEALYMAKDLLAGWLIDAEDEKEAFPVPSDHLSILVAPEDLLIPIEIDLAFYRKKFYSKPIKKTLTIPSYLNDLGNEAKINFSATLTEALKEKLEV